MPILDYADEFTTKDGQAVTAAAIGTKVKDAGAGRTAAATPTRDWGSGTPLVAYARVTGAAASNPITSMTIEIIAADNAALTTNPVVLASTSVLAAALTANSLHRIGALKAGSPKRYLGCKFTPVGGNATTGAFICGLIDEKGRPQDGANYL
jgi:hypothetical protein